MHFLSAVNERRLPVLSPSLEAGEDAAMKKISIIGLGDVLRGDHGAACYVLEAVAKEVVDECVQIDYLGNDPRFAGRLLYQADRAIVVGTLCLSGVPGGLHVWDGRVSKQHAAWMAEADTAFRHLLIALARADLAGGFPEKLLFLWTEPQFAEGYAISKPVRSTIQLSARLIFRELCRLELGTSAERHRLLNTFPVAGKMRN